MKNEDLVEALRALPAVKLRIFATAREVARRRGRKWTLDVDEAVKRAPAIEDAAREARAYSSSVGMLLRALGPISRG